MTEITLGENVSVNSLYFTSSGSSASGGSIQIAPGSGSYKVNVTQANSKLLYISGLQNTTPITIGTDIAITDYTPTADTTSRISSDSSWKGSLTINGNINFSGATSGTKTIAFDATGGGTMVYNGSTTTAPGGTATMRMSFGHTTTSDNNGTYVLGGSNSAVSTVQVARGTVILNDANALNGAGGVTVSLGSSTTTSLNVAEVLAGKSGLDIKNIFSGVSGSAATNILGGSYTSGVSTFSGGVSLSGGAVTLTQAAGGVVNFSGQLYSTANSYGLTKTGAGVVRLSRTAGQSFSGATAINAGTMLVTNSSGNGLGGGAVSVGTGTATLAVLGGTGRITSAVTLNGGGSIAPGDIDNATLISLPGTLTLTSGLNWNSDNTNAGMHFQLGANTATSDQLTIGGAFTQGTGSSFLFNFLSLSGGLTVGTTYNLITYGSTTFLDASVFGLDAATQSLGIAGDFTLSGNQLNFTVTAVPEPSVALYMLVIMGIFFCVILRRKSVG